jgi:hypothetical protein
MAFNDEELSRMMQTSKDLTEIGSEISDLVGSDTVDKMMEVGPQMVDLIIDLNGGVAGERVRAATVRNYNAQVAAAELIMELNKRYSDAPEIAHELIAQFMEAQVAASEMVLKKYKQMFAAA